MISRSGVWSILSVQRRYSGHRRRSMSVDTPLPPVMTTQPQSAEIPRAGPFMAAMTMSQVPTGKPSMRSRMTLYSKMKIMHPMISHLRLHLISIGISNWRSRQSRTGTFFRWQSLNCSIPPVHISGQQAVWWGQSVQSLPIS